MSMNENNMITISVEEYKKLIAISVRVEVFAAYVNSERYAVSREDCGSYLGFKVSGYDD